MISHPQQIQPSKYHDLRCRVTRATKNAGQKFGKLAWDATNSLWQVDVFLIGGGILFVLRV
jgi:hypothetical protein